MGDQTKQRLNLCSQTEDACRRFLAAYHDLSQLLDRAPYMGTVTDADFQGTALAHLDAAVVLEVFQHVIPAFRATYADNANAGRNRRVLNQFAGSV